jgi:LPS export ABC transporter protein LptC
MKSNLVFICIIAGLGFKLISCSEQTPIERTPDLEALRSQEPRSEIHNFSYLFSELGKPRARLTAPFARDFYRADVGETEFRLYKAMAIQFFDSLGQPASQLTAREGTLFQNKGYAEAIGQVVWTNNKGERLETERLRWFRHLNQVSTPDFVKITTPRDVLYGDSLVANLAFSKYQIYKIRGQFLLDEFE